MTDAANVGSEVVLATLPAAEAKSRTLVVLVPTRGEGAATVVQLRQQSFGGEALGWFTQSTVTLEPEQVAALRNTLGFSTQGVSTGAAAKSSARKLPREYSQLAPRSLSWQPRVVHAEGA